MDSAQKEWEKCGKVLKNFINSHTPKDALNVLKTEVYEMFPEVRFLPYGEYSSNEVNLTKKELKSLLLTPQEHKHYSRIIKNTIKPYKSFLLGATMLEKDMHVERILSGDIILQYDYVLAYSVVTFFKKENAIDYVGQCSFCGKLFLSKRRNRRKYCDNKGKCRKAASFIKTSLES